jgi:sacsin
MLKGEWVDFGQQERLTVRLKELIRNYPRGIGIIKEFIQNADDAGARSLSVVLDLRVHPANRLPDLRMKALMGPALLIANESVFSPRDFQSIQHIGESNKTESGPKTGRFGLGFNTCYNVTDYPSFVTGEDVVCFDPHQNAIAQSGAQPGVRGALKDVWMTSPDWLATFMVAGLTLDAPYHEGTIFRLPLRTLQQAAASEISKESFGKDAFDEIVSQLKTVGPELLLFTKHLLSIAVIEVAEEAAEPKVVLRVSTPNAEAVSAAREEILAAVDGYLPELLAKWREHSVPLPCVTYTHEFEIADDGQIETQSWRVTNGLFSDPQKKLLSAAQAMLTVGEKAVPWAGAAAKLVTVNGTLAVARVDGRMYCGLPLTDETQLPVHINGYFDLDSSRRALSAGRDVIGANRARVEWNEQLMQYGVATAYSTLLMHLRDAAEADVQAFYETFPDLKAMKSKLFSTLGRSVYFGVANQPTTRAYASGKPDWLPIEKVWLARDSLKPPLIAEGKPVAEPSLPPHVKIGFETVGQTLTNLTPKRLREFLRTDHDVDIPLEHSSRPCLRRRDWVEEMLRFCLEDGTDTSLQGLPLALLCDGKLHTFGHSKAGLIFSASVEQRHIFAECSHWFIDPDFEKSVGIKEQPKARFSYMTAAAVISNLAAILGKESSGAVIDWEPEGGDTPNAEWLTAAFSYFAKIPDPELMKSAASLQSWPLLPDQANRLYPIHSAVPPMFRPSEPAYRKLVGSLEILGVPLLSGPPSVVEALRQFATAHPKCIDAEMTGTRLITALGAHEKALKEHGGAHNPKIHDPLVNFLSDDRFLTTYTEAALTRLRSLPLLPTTGSGIVRADAPDVFVSTNYTPPPCSPSVTLLKPGPEGRWKKLLHKLKVRRLDQQTLIEQVLLPKYGTVAPEDQRAILKWIRDHLSAEVTRLDKTEPGTGQKLLKAIREAELVRCTDGRAHKGSDLYDPREPVVREVLGNRAAIPDTSIYPSTDPAWLSFFELLGMEKTPRPKDLLNYIDALVLQGRAGTTAVAGRLMEIFDFLQKNWTSLAASPVSDGSIPIEFSTALKNRAWLPAQRNPRYIDDYPGFVLQEDRFYRPSEIYPSSLIHQIGSVLPVLANSQDAERDIRIKLSMPGRAPLEAVLKHFDRLIELWQKPEHSGIKPERIETSFKSIYRYLGTLAGEAEPGRNDFARVLQLLEPRYKGQACIWDPKTRHLWKPEDVFLEKVPFFEPHRTQVFYSEDRINTGLIALGRRLSPAVDDYREFLRDLHTELSDDVLTETQQSQVLYSLRHIADYRPNDTEESGLPLLARNGRLRLGNALLWEDTIRWQDKIDLSLVPLVHKQLPPAIVVPAGALRISEHLLDELVSEPQRSEGHGLEGLCERAAQTIRSGQFADAVRRLIRYQSGPNMISNAESVARIRVVAAVSIQLETILNLNGSTTRLGEYEASSFFRKADATLFVSGSSERQLIVVLAKAINAILQPALSDLAALQDILRAAPEEIQGILYDYEIPAIETDDESQAIFEDEPPTQESNSSEEDESQEWTDYAEDEMPQPTRDEAQTDAGTGVQRKNRSGEPLLPGVRRSIPASHSLGAGTSPKERVASGGEGRTPSRGAEPQSAGGTNDRPPTLPGGGKSGWEGVTGPHTRGDDLSERHQRGRIVTYVEGTIPRAEDHEPRDSEADAIGDAAVDYVFGIEERGGRQPVKMDHDNEGFDIIAKDSDDQLCYIEVKGIDGAWGDTGVRLTRAQFLYAQKERKRFWLYVVENARSGSPTLYRINDPATQITQYRFDAGWKSLAENASATERPSSRPVTGMRVSYDNGAGTMVAGTITRVERNGLIVRLHIRTDSGIELKKFICSSMRFSKPEGEVADAANAARTD